VLKSYEDYDDDAYDDDDDDEYDDDDDAIANLRKFFHQLSQ